MCQFIHLVDGSPDHLWFSGNWEIIPGNHGLNEPVVTLADTLYAVNPNVKIIILLRNPIDRCVNSCKHIIAMRMSREKRNSFVKVIRDHALNDISKVVDENCPQSCNQILDYKVIQCISKLPRVTK